MCLYIDQHSSLFKTDNEVNDKEKENETIHLLEKSIRDSEAIDTESLCIVAGQKVWSIQCEVMVLHADGNIIDAVCLAAMSSLRAFRKPDVTIIRESGKHTTLHVHGEDERESLPLALHHTPLTVTFALFEGIITFIHHTYVSILIYDYASCLVNCRYQ